MLSLRPISALALRASLPRACAARAESTHTHMYDSKLYTDRLFPSPKRWPEYNRLIHRPEDGAVERYCCHHRANIKYSPKKMFYVASFVRGMDVDEALRQLAYVKMKGASYVAEVLEEARQVAIQEHNFEFRSKMWIAESFVAKGVVFRGMRKHARMRFGEVRYFHCHYLVRLVEGEAPEHYLPSQAPQPRLLSGEERIEQHIDKLRRRRIEFGL